VKTAGTIVAAIAGAIVGVYLLGALVIALRLLFDGFEPSSVVSILAQLPTQLLTTTALLAVVLPATLLGVAAIVILGLRPFWEFLLRLLKGITRPFRWVPGAGWRLLRRLPVFSSLDSVARWVGRQLAAIPGSAWRSLGLLIVSVLLAVPAVVVAIASEEGWTSWMLLSLLGVGLTYVAATLFVELHPRIAGWSGLGRLSATGGAVAVVALVPALMLASAVDFESAQVCTTGKLTAERGTLIGEGGGDVLLEIKVASEERVVSVPADEVTRSEYGDLVTDLRCQPLSKEEEAEAAAAEAALGPHGSPAEVQLATALRPYLLFDSLEHWRPLDVEAFANEHFVDGREDEICRNGEPPSCEPLTGLGQLHGGPDGFDYVDIHGNDRENGGDYRSPGRGCRSTSPPAFDCNAGKAAVIYYRRSGHEGSWYWDYWWFLRYNDYSEFPRTCNSRFCGDHEGDWEGITVVTTASAQPVVLQALYAAHRNRVLVERVELPEAEGHPLVWVARGTHASYPYACSEECHQYETLAGVAHLPEDPHDGAVSWGGNSEADCAKYSCVQPLPEAGVAPPAALPHAGGWAAWNGLWGKTCHSGCHEALTAIQASPRSPGTQARYACPSAATDIAKLNRDGVLSGAERAGDAVSVYVACQQQRGGG
jgi:hypothetical protein